MDNFPTFFGLLVKTGFDYKTLLKEELLLTRAIISPDAEPNQTASLFLKTDGKRVPLCHLDGSTITTCPLNITLFPGMECIFSASGDCPIHLIGFNVKRTNQSFISSVYEISGK